MDNNFKIATVFLSMGMICFITFEFIGSKVEKDGILNEPFFLIPIGSVLVLISVLLYLLFAFKKSSIDDSILIRRLFTSFF